MQRLIGQYMVGYGNGNGDGRGIGGIAKAEYKDEYILDPIGNVEIRQNKVLFEILCEWE